MEKPKPKWVKKPAWKKRAVERQRERRAERRLLGLCTCGKALEPERLGQSYCLNCSRKHTIQYHAHMNYKRFYDGSPTSPLRPGKILKDFQLENPLLRKVSPDVQKWIDEHIEVFSRPKDRILDFQSMTLSAVFDDSGNLIEGKNLSSAWLERNNGVSLEDYVIEKVDREKEEKAAYV